MASRAELSCCAFVGAAAVGVIFVRLASVADAAEDTWAELAVVEGAAAVDAIAMGSVTAVGSDSPGNPIANAAASSERRAIDAQVASVVRCIFVQVKTRYCLPWL